MRKQPKQGSLALAIAVSAAAGAGWFMHYQAPANGSPFTDALACLCFLLLMIYVGGSILFPGARRGHAKDSASRRLALQRRRIGGLTATHERCLRIDQEGIFETRLGLIAWPQVLGLSAETSAIDDAPAPALRIYLRDPWRYLDNDGSTLLAWGYRLHLARDARHGRIDIPTQAYRVDAETACEVARSLRGDCAEPWIEDWDALMSAAVIEQRLREFLAAAQPAHAALAASPHREASG